MQQFAIRNASILKLRSIERFVSFAPNHKPDRIHF